MTRHTHGHDAAPKTRGRVIRWAQWYDAVTWLLTMGREPAIRKMTLKLAKIRPGESVLDVGCGTGTLTIAAKTKAGPEGRVDGIDAAPEMIAVARRKAGKRGAGVDFQAALIEEIPFPDGAFDAVLSSLMLHHLPEDVKRAGFGEIRRVLKPGGRFLAIDIGPAGGGFAGHVIGALTGHLHGHGEFSGLAAMLSGAGFTDVESGRTKFGPLWFVRATAPAAG